MSFNNRNNLPNTSAPWGREVEQRIESAERNISQTSLESSNGLSSVSNTLATLSNTINALATQQTMLVEQQTRLVESKSIRTRAGGYVKASGGATTRYFTEYETSISKPTWAKNAVVWLITSNPAGSVTLEEDAYVTSSAKVSNSPIPESAPTDYISWLEIWSFASSGQTAYAQPFVVNMSASSVVYVKQILTLSYVTTANISFNQSIVIDWS